MNLSEVKNLQRPSKQQVMLALAALEHLQDAFDNADEYLSEWLYHQKSSVGLPLLEVPDYVTIDNVRYTTKQLTSMLTQEELDNLPSTYS